MSLYVATVNLWYLIDGQRKVRQRRIIVEAETIHDVARIAEAVANANWGHDCCEYRSAYRIGLPAELKLEISSPQMDTETEKR